MAKKNKNKKQGQQQQQQSKITTIDKPTAKVQIKDTKVKDSNKVNGSKKLGNNGSSVQLDDDFIFTIEDDEVIEGIDDDDESSATTTKSANKKSQKNSKENNEMELDPSFTFDLEDPVANYKSQFKSLEFDSAKSNLRTRNLSGRTTLDSKIAHQLAKSKAEDNSENEDDEDDEDEDEDEEDDDEIEKNEDKNKRPKVESIDLDDESDLSDGVEDEASLKRKAEYFAPEAENNTNSLIDSFNQMNLSRPLVKGLTNLGFVRPTPIQSRAIPVALMGKDLCGGAVTGSGKTAAFIVPIIERLLFRPKAVPLTRVLVLCPTRELAIQCHNVAIKLATFTDITFCLAVGGLSLKSQEAVLKTRPDFVIATPGRLIDHLRNSSSFNLDSIEILVMDEADRMLEDGFAEELNQIIQACPSQRQTMLFSATMTDNVDQLIRMSLKRPVRLMVDSSTSTAKKLTQEFVRVRAHRESDRPAMLISLVKTFKKKCIVFFKSKAMAHQMKIVFGLLGLKAAELHGNLTQEMRMSSLELFRDGEVDFLLATDLASRGLDIQGVDTVINYQLPSMIAPYLHRVGRTARAGRSGRAISLVGESDRKILKLAIRASQGESIQTSDGSFTSKVRQRSIDADTLAKINRKLEKLKDQVQAILKEEKEEKEIAQAEMQVNKATNLLIHADEIKAKPKRTWFKEESDKKSKGGKKQRPF